MKYQCQRFDPTGRTTYTTDFLTSGAKSLLDGAETQIYDDWSANFPKEKSLASVMTRTVLTQIRRPGFAMRNEISKSYGVSQAFHNRGMASSMFVEMFRNFNTGKLTDYLIITQTEGFKKKFLYDSTAMTIESVVKDFNYFLDSMALTVAPNIYFLVFENLSFTTSVWKKGKSSYLKLNHD